MATLFMWVAVWWPPTHTTYRGKFFPAHLNQCILPLKGLALTELATLHLHKDILVLSWSLESFHFYLLHAYELCLSYLRLLFH